MAMYDLQNKKKKKKNFHLEHLQKEAKKCSACENVKTEGMSRLRKAVIKATKNLKHCTV